MAILGFGKEGQSTFRLIRTLLPGFPLVICDKNENLINNVDFQAENNLTSCFFGEGYLKGLQDADVIIKSPGISYMSLEGHDLKGRITSQTELFLELFGKKVIGITGTKGKSTTTSLLFHIMKLSGKKVLLAGNIGVPPFDLTGQIDQDTQIIYEMSSHQLEHTSVSPRIAILLNIFQEHLDHYHSYAFYQNAKMNIARFQGPNDYFIFNNDDEIISSNLKKMDVHSQMIKVANTQSKGFSSFFTGDDLHVTLPSGSYTLPGLGRKRKLAGAHNLLNIAAACTAALIEGVTYECISEGVASFNGLPHRLEFVGSINGVDYYNDSIATIPEAAIEALRAWPLAQTIILGGYDRGVDYRPFIGFLMGSQVKNLILMGEAGKRMLEIIKSKSDYSHDKVIVLADNLEQAFKLAVDYTQPGHACLLSPAAASYDAFRNFEERGDSFRKLVQQGRGFE